MPRYKKKFWINLSVLILLIILLIVFLLLRQNVQVAEFITNTFGRYYQFIATYLFSYIPISLLGVGILALIIYLIVWLVHYIRHLKRNGKRFSSQYWFKLGYISLSLGLIYLLTAGMAYNRLPLDSPAYNVKEVDESEYMDIANYFLDDYNEVTNKLTFNEDTGEVINPYSLKEMNEILKREFSKLDQNYFYQAIPQIKEFHLLSYFYRELQIIGVTFVPLAEANLNNLMTKSEYPFTAAHEIAHTLGVMREEDANLVAFYICYTSNDPYFRYSAYQRTFSSLYPFVLTRLGLNGYQAFVNKLGEKIINNMRYDQQYWSNYHLLDDVGNFFNNIYLFLSGNKGTSSYNDNLDTDINQNPDGTIKYTIGSFSRYQNLYLYFYFNNL